MQERVLGSTQERIQEQEHARVRNKGQLIREGIMLYR